MDSFKNNLLENKTALITGGGGLLGPQHAIALAGVGAKVILLDINKNGLEEAKSKILEKVDYAKIECYEVDIGELKEVEDLSHMLTNKNDHIDILVNNAAINPKMKDIDGEVLGRIEDYDIDQWNLELKVGITGTFICSRVFGSKMALKQGGVIINISSDLAIRSPDQRVYSPTGSFDDIKSFKPLGYSTVKTAVIGMTRYFSEYWGYKNIRVNALLPGGVFNNQGKELVKNVKDRTLLGRWAKVTEYNDAIVFLSSDASSFMTGQMLIMDGGRSVW